MKLRFAISALFFSLTTLMAQTPASPSPVPAPEVPAFAVPGDIEFLKDVEIGTGGGRPLHAYVFYPKAPQEKLLPGLILIHGGRLGERHPCGTYRD